MGIGYTVLASCPGTLFPGLSHCLQSLSESSRVFAKIAQNVTNIVENVANCIKSRIVWLPHPVIDVQILISKTCQK